MPRSLLSPRIVRTGRFNIRVIHVEDAVRACRALVREHGRPYLAARALGTSRKNFHHWLHGLRPPTVKTWRKRFAPALSMFVDTPDPGALALDVYEMHRAFGYRPFALTDWRLALKREPSPDASERSWNRFVVKIRKEAVPHTVEHRPDDRNVYFAATSWVSFLPEVKAWLADRLHPVGTQQIASAI